MSSETAFFETLKETISCIGNDDRQFLHQFSLTIPRYYALKHIHKNMGVSLTTLSALMLNDKSSTTHLIRSIEEGLVRQRRSESDRRTYCPSLSDSGQQLFQHASAAHDTYTWDRFSGLDIDVEALVNDLVVIIHSLERDSKREE